MLRPGLEHQQIDFACQLFTQYKKRLQVKIQIQVKIHVLQMQAKIKGQKTAFTYQHATSKSDLNDEEPLIKATGS